MICPFVTYVGIVFLKCANTVSGHGLPRYSRLRRRMRLFSVLVTLLLLLSLSCTSLARICPAPSPQGSALLHTQGVFLIFNTGLRIRIQSGRWIRIREGKNDQQKLNFLFVSSCFEVLDGLFRELKASFVTWTFFMEA